MSAFILPFICFFSLILSSFSAFGAENGGTLIVTYQTGPKGERLNRVRFWVRPAQEDPQLYPKGNSFVEDESNMTRIVVIENLAPGKYMVEFVVPNSDGLFEPIPKREIHVLSGKVVKIDQLIKPRYASLKVKTSIESTDAATLKAFPRAYLRNQQGQIVAESTDGKYTAHHLVPGKYRVVFENLPGFIAPPAMELTLAPNQNFGPIEGVYINELISFNAAGDKAYQETNFDNMQKTVLVPEGKAIIGDPFQDNRENVLSSKIIKLSSFYIGIYEITNFQYAQWLTQALKEGKIIYHTDKEKRGLVTDKQGQLLFKTKQADPYSQIFAENIQDKIQFFPEPGKHKYPVIDVSWYGAQAYCKDHQCRLPTEAEWEKAAGMAITPPGEPLKKYRFGFGRDEIDPTWANYNYNSRDQRKFAVNTTPIGFYNGLNKLPKTEGSREEKTTHLAVSPVGAYDMSGNVWEWVSDWYADHFNPNMPDNDPQGPETGINKVAKGGCYDSFADGVRVPERIGLPPDHADPFTGFRVAADKQKTE